MVKNSQLIIRCVSFAATMFAAGCSTLSGSGGYDAYGYLSPVPDGDGEYLGNFATREECQAATDDWMSRQVVGHAISAECYAVDRR